MVGVAVGGVGFWPDTKSGGGCCRFMARYEERGGGGGGCCRILAQNEQRGGGGGGGGGAVGLWPDTKGGGGEYDRVSGGPGYSTVVEFYGR